MTRPLFSGWRSLVSRRAPGGRRLSVAGVAVLLVVPLLLVLGLLLLLARFHYELYCARVSAQAWQQLRQLRTRDARLSAPSSLPPSSLLHLYDDNDNHDDNHDDDYDERGMVDLPILMPACTRPEYLRQVLEALSRCHNIVHATVVFSQDGDMPEVTDLLRHWNASRYVVHLRHIRPHGGIPTFITGNEYATSANVHFLLSFAFDYMRAPGAILLESDLVPSVDMYDYFQWSFRHFLDKGKMSDRVWTVSGFNMESSREGNPYGFFPYKFMVWGWCMSRKFWPLMNDEWTKYHGWGTAVDNMRIRHGLVSVSPEVSRIRNIGMQGINFRVTSPEDIRRWESLHIQPDVLEYSKHLPSLTGYSEYGICRAIEQDKDLCEGKSKEPIPVSFLKI